MVFGMLIPINTMAIIALTMQDAGVSVAMLINCFLGILYFHHNEGYKTE